MKEKVEKDACLPAKAGMLWLFKQVENKEANQITYQFWQSDNHAVGCFSLPFAWQKLTYIYNNPVWGRHCK
jgi:hypothetical protein